jgi:hypothetical protein
MYHLFKAFFGLTALAALLILSIFGGCADIPDNGMPDDPVDTVVIVDTVVRGDTLVRCVTAVVGAGAASVRCDTTLYGGVSVPYAVSRVDERVNNYCLFPITFTAFPRAEDLGLIDSICLELGPDSGARVWLSPPAWSAEFVYADTGTHRARMLVSFKGVGAVPVEEFDVRTAMKIDAAPVVVPVGEAGVEHTLRVSGLRYSGVRWVWDLTNINNGIMSTQEDSVSIFVDGEYDTEIYLYQEDAFGNRTPATVVGFASVYTAHSVVVSVEGGEADVLPQRSFSVPHAGDATVSVRVDTRNNLKIGGIGINGKQRYAFNDRVVDDTAIIIENIRSNVGVLVTVARIDTVQPQLIEDWLTGRDTVTIMACMAGKLLYRLNKKMASGYVLWTRIDTATGGLIESSSVRVAFPDDLNGRAHLVGGRIPYLQPSDYLREGLQKYIHDESAQASKRIDFQMGMRYRAEMRFADSLGNKTNIFVKIMNIIQSNYGCSTAVPAWLDRE